MRLLRQVFLCCRNKRNQRPLVAFALLRRFLVYSVFISFWKTMEFYMSQKTCECQESKCQNSDIDCATVKQMVAAHEKKPASLIPVLQDVQQEYGYLPREALDIVARGLNLSVSNIYGVATFYKQFRLVPQGEHLIKVCHGTACHVAGAEGISVVLRSDLDVEDDGTTDDMKFTLESVACLGCCSLAPVITVGEDTHGRLTPDKAKKVVSKYAK